MAKGSLQLDLLGTSFAIQADERPEYLEGLYAHLKKTIKQIETTSSITDPLKIAIIAGVLISDELYKEKQKNHREPTSLDLDEAEKIALGMISRIDQVI
ncbi:MAG: cell division protein ZapA [Spirochaetales bacterium]|nr:cell division protein ZapA [Spirochaetales bacterium]HNQ97060.1 cell division protein ZapA [Treponemataceae bacterium]